eukprot:CAMPEP_0116143560 /NCGR_PEP_ID=MMETSP0329-20121206/15517_1 /TAXON_ID=697910 /ORGANISM="Pseudo-nitzschia arenysensis, Strain B593" /LENGTH=307 /DNA_ID=CAMNT_0003638891 /DNA_START=26 /DNA_END=949 /DNA_ORIENTATION=-
MTECTRTQGVSTETDKHICKYLLSTLRDFGIDKYKIHYGVSFPESTKKVCNRIQYLKRLQTTNSQRFSNILQTYGIPIMVSNDDSLEEPKSCHTVAPQTIPPSEQKRKRENAKTMVSSNFDKRAVQKHKHHLVNFEKPYLNRNSMIWFRDDNVEIGNSFFSIVTIYQPLLHALDHELITLKVDKNDPTVLIHTQPAISTYMHRNWENIHRLESGNSNPELYSPTRKKHKKLAHQIANKRHIPTHQTYYQLPFPLALDRFGGIKNSQTKLKKHLRLVPTNVPGIKTQICSYIWWKVLIDGETVHFGDF